MREDQDLGLFIEITEYDFNKQSLPDILNNRWVKDQWPLVYFIKNENEKIAYVGESTNAFNRMNNHLGNENRLRLNSLSIIGCDRFNKSATLDIESNLIQYISSEGTFVLQNANNGLSHHNYYQRDVYKSLFKEIWKKLVEKKIVYKTLEEIQNTIFFKYSPYKSLSGDQYNAVLNILETLVKKTAAPIFVRGSAGTGKTILATYLIKLLASNTEDGDLEEIDPEMRREAELIALFHAKYPHPKIALVVAMTSLRVTLQNVFEKIPGLKRQMVISPTDSFKEKYDILIIDEAHRLRQRKNISWMGVFTANNQKLGLGHDGNELDWVMANSEHQLFFYDEAQSVKPSDVPRKRFEMLLAKPDTVLLNLRSQMRVSAGSDYITFVDRLLNSRLTESEKQYIPQDYDLRVFDSFSDLYTELEKKEKELGLSRMIAGYSWPWKTKEDVSGDKFDIELDGLQFRWNSTDKDWINTAGSFREIGCIHTTQGYDLNYAGVIFGKEIQYNPSTDTIEIVAKEYHDRNGKAGIKNPAELKEYIINIYKTLLYRGIRGTFLYAVDKNLNAYFKSKIAQGQDKRPFKILNIAEVKPFVNAVPLFNIRAAAGDFSNPQQSENTEWVVLPAPHRAREDYFVCRVEGESMNRIIPSGSWCLFRKDPGGTREGKIVLVQHYAIQEPDFGAGFTVKSYTSQKQIDADGWSHSSIVLKPMSDHAGYADIVLQEDELQALKVVGIFVAVLK